MRIHSWVSPKCEVRPSPLGGFGVFAAEPMIANDLICIWGGVVYTADEVEELSAEHPDLATHTVSMWDGFYLGPLRPGDPPDAAELINHSCDASAGVRGQVVIVARRGIASGDEITLDYDTTETAATGGFACRCGSPHCRAVIDGTGWRRDEFRIRYAGFLSWYIAERIGRELGRPTEPSARHPVAP